MNPQRMVRIRVFTLLMVSIFYLSLHPLEAKDLPREDPLTWVWSPFPYRLLFGHSTFFGEKKTDPANERFGETFFGSGSVSLFGGFGVGARTSLILTQNNLRWREFAPSLFWQTSLNSAAIQAYLQFRYWGESGLWVGPGYRMMVPLTHAIGARIAVPLGGEIEFPITGQDPSVSRPVWQLHGGILFSWKSLQVSAMHVLGFAPTEETTSQWSQLSFNWMAIPAVDLGLSGLLGDGRWGIQANLGLHFGAPKERIDPTFRQELFRRHQTSMKIERVAKPYHLILAKKNAAPSPEVGSLWEILHDDHSIAKAQVVGVKDLAVILQVAEYYEGTFPEQADTLTPSKP